ncbi:AAA family ATPase [Metapseudomonas furukawaii]|uniref:AAA family ATPase n=1 Tax=Metapseudomonas furukawaii TaxID=1149133 RepID=UPI00227A3EF0|nr:AAA family ATPase [Pseudomonas furukawaii]WAG80948.1 AAA family ATPase [Pseudomonas furukawaii]
MKVLVLTGPESSGKSWLGAALRDSFGGLLVGEYVRHFIDREQRDTCYADIPAIARGQLEWEDHARAEAPPLLVLDTHLLSNILWSRKLFGDCPEWLEEALLSRRYDLHLLLSPEGVPWVGDGQRCQPALVDRLAFFRESQAWLEANGQRYEILGGDWGQRRARALASVSAWLDEHQASPGH